MDIHQALSEVNKDQDIEHQLVWDGGVTSARLFGIDDEILLRGPVTDLITFIQGMIYDRRSKGVTS